MMRANPVSLLTNAPSRLPTAQRLWLVLTQVALFLPFVTARGCGNSNITEYTGIDLYFFESSGGLFALLLVVMSPLLAFPYVPQVPGRALAALGVRAWFAGAGVLLALAAPSAVLLFESLDHHVGWFLHVGGWAALYGAYLVGSAVLLARGAGALPRGSLAATVIALLAAPPLAVVVKGLHDDPTPSDTFLALAIGYGMSLPLVFAGFGLAHESAAGTSVRTGTAFQAVWAPWWGLAMLTLGMHVLGAVAD